MYKGKVIGVVVPAYNEQSLISATLLGMPDFVDKVFVVNDGSTDKTLGIIQTLQASSQRIVLIDHPKNKGLGQSLIDGYQASLQSDVELTAVMAGDNQMDPQDLPGLLDPLIEQNYDYIKGNRLLHQNINSMPAYRFFGNSILTLLTKFATGYYALMDPQCGYTAIKNSVLRRIPIQKMTTGYGYNADILCMLNIQGFRVTDVEVRPVYGQERSKIILSKYIWKTSRLLVNLFFRRLWNRYVILDFNPLVLFYFFSFLNLLFIVIPLFIRFFYMYNMYHQLPQTTLIILIFTTLLSFQSILFAVWMDMDYNHRK